MRDYKKLINHHIKETRELWQRSASNKFKKLLKGVGWNKNGTQRVKRSDTINFIRRKQVPNDKKIMYTQCCCNIWLQTEEISRTRLTVGGDRLEYDRKKTSTKKAWLKTIKIYLNKTISTKEAKYKAVNIKINYTNSKLESSEYIRIYFRVLLQ